MDCSTWRSIRKFCRKPSIPHTRGAQIHCSLSQVAASTELADGFVSFTTSRDFDPVPGRNWRIAAKALAALIEEITSISPRAVVLADQVHGNVVKPAGRASGVELLARCDGLLACQPGTFLVIRTADCLPIILVEPQAHHCAALHAGWQGSLLNIMEQGIRALEHHGADSSRMRGWIGPRIGGERYEVSEDLLATFLEKHGHLGHFSDGRLLDLPRLNQLQAEAAGMKPGAIADCRLCTLTEKALLYSHRRQGRNRGQQFTVCGFLG